MKKFLFIFALVAGTMLQAAAVRWTTFPGAITDASSNPLSSGIAYLVNATTTVDSNFEASTTIVGSASVTNGSVSLTTSEENLTLGTTYDFYMIVFNAAKFADATAYMISTAISAQPYDNTTTGGPITELSFGSLFEDGGQFTSSTWETFSPTGGSDDPSGDVPEPTVLALLALGVAGLALRRRA